MANLAGQFAGMVHFEVPAQNAEPLTQALRGLESSGLRVVIAKVETPPAPAGRRMVKLELTGLDRPGIVRDLSRSLRAARRQHRRPAHRDRQRRRVGASTCSR